MTKSQTDSSSSINSLITRVVLATSLAALASILVGYLAKGVAGAIGAAIAGAIVVVFFSIGQLILSAVIRKNPTMAMSVAMLMYLIKIGVLFVLLLVFKNTSAFDTKVFALTVLACTLVWTATEVWVFSTTKVLYVDPENQPEIVPSVTDSDHIQ